MADRNATVSLKLRFLVEQLQDVLRSVEAVDKFGREAVDSSRQANQFSAAIQRLASQSRALLQNLDRGTLDGTAQSFDKLRRQADAVSNAISGSSLDEAVAGYQKLTSQIEKVGTELQQARASSQALNDAIRGGGATEAQSVEYERLRRVIAALRSQQQGLIQQQQAYDQVISQAKTREYADQFATLNDDLRRIQDQLRDTGQEARRLNQALASGDTTASIDDYRKLQQRLRELRTEQAALRARLTDTAASLKRNGVSTREYANAQARLQSALRQSRVEMQQVANEAIRVRSAIQASLADPTKSARAGYAQLFSQLTGLNTILGALATGAAVYGIINLGKASLDSAKQIEALERSLNAFAGNQRSLSLIGELTDEASRLGVNVKLLSQPFAEFIAATKELNVEESEALRLFGSFSESLIRTGKDATALSDTLLGLNQSLRQGNLQYDEFRQIASRIPGAFEAASAAFGVTTAGLKDFIASGKAIFNEERLVTFIERLGVATGNTGERIEGIAQAEGRLGNALTRLGANFAESTGLASAYTSVVEGLAGAFGSLADTLETRDFTPEEQIAVLTGTFEESAQRLREIREAALQANQEVAKTDAAEGPAKIREEIDKLKAAYVELQNQQIASNALGIGDPAGTTASLLAIQDRVSALRDELKSLELQKSVGEILSTTDTAGFAAGIGQVITQLQDIAPNAKASDEALTSISRVIAKLNQAQLSSLTEQVKAAQAQTDNLGKSTDNLDALLSRLESEAIARANNALNQFADASANASEKLEEGFERLAADIEAKERLAAANVNAAKSEVEIAQARLEVAQINAELSDSDQARLEVVARQNALDQARLELSRQVAEQARVELSVAQGKIGLIDAEIQAQQSLINTLRAKADAGDSTDEIQGQIEGLSKKIQKLKEEKASLETVADAANRAAEAAAARLAADQAATRVLKDSEKAALASASSYEEAAKAALKLLQATAGTERADAGRLAATKALGAAAEKERLEREKTRQSTERAATSTAKLADNAERATRETVKSTGAAQKVANAFNAAVAATSALSKETEILFREKIARQFAGANAAAYQYINSLKEAQTATGAISQEINKLNARLNEIKEFELKISPSGVSQVLVDIARARAEAELAFREQQLAAAKLEGQLRNAAAESAGATDYLVRQAERAVTSFGLLDQEDLSGLQAAIDQSRAKLEQFNQQLLALDEQIRAREAELAGSGEEFRINQQLKDDLAEIATLREQATGQQLIQLDELERIAKANAKQELTRIKNRKEAEADAADAAAKSRNAASNTAGEYERIERAARGASEAAGGLTNAIPAAELGRAANDAERLARGLSGAATGVDGSDNVTTAAQSRLSLYEQQIAAAERLRAVNAQSASEAIDQTERLRVADNALTEQQISNRRRVALASGGSGSGSGRSGSGSGGGVSRPSARRRAELSSQDGDAIRSLNRSFVSSGGLSG